MLVWSEADPMVTSGNVEYNQLAGLMKDAGYGGDEADESGFSPFPGNLNILIFSIPEYAKTLEKCGGM
eukprot:1332515-Amorphochlora_amoeboformis.AAC.1